MLKQSFWSVIFVAGLFAGCGEDPARGNLGGDGGTSDSGMTDDMGRPIDMGHPVDMAHADMADVDMVIEMDAGDEDLGMGSDGSVGMDGGGENTVEACMDGVDNDGDRYIDCNDFNCCSLVACAAGTSCNRVDGGRRDGGPRDGSISCAAEETMCSGVCVKTDIDVANCGGCGNACADGEACNAGTCGPLACDGTLTSCSGACVDTDTDPANCGACGNTCTVTDMCMGGFCVSACPAPNTLCSITVESSTVTMCVDTATDSANCGDCNAPCRADQICSGGSCDCAMGRTDCSGACVDTVTDSANCGSCGHACGAGQNCVGSTCVCGASEMLCGDVCVNTMSSHDNCGSCDHACGGSESCGGGVCTSICAGMPGTTACGAECVNLTNDNMNCGGCGVTCASNATCTASACVPTNDTRINAIALNLASHMAEQTFTGSNSNAHADGNSSCLCDNQHGVWYSFTVAEGGEVVYFDTFGSGFDTSLSLRNSTGGFVTDASSTHVCNDDALCTGAGLRDDESQVAFSLSAGSYYVVVDGCATGNYTLHVQHFPRSLSSYVYDSPLSGSGNTSTYLIGTSASVAECTGIGDSGEDARWFLTCSSSSTQTFSLCGPDGGSWTQGGGTYSYDPELYIYSAQSAATVQCNDDGGFGCGATDNAASTYGPRLSGVTAGRGLNVIYVDERNNDSGLTYTLHYAVSR